MSRLLERLLGRLPIGWLQLIHNRTRFAAALAGVAFATLLIFMQLGFLGALIHSIALPYEAMKGDLIIMSPDANTLADSSPVPRQRLFEALSLPDISTAAPVYYGKIDWKLPDGTLRVLDVFGVDPSAETFKAARFQGNISDLTLQNYALIDAKTRNPPKGTIEAISAGQPYRLETKGRTITISGTLDISGGMLADGYLLVSDQTFMHLFPQRSLGAPNLVLLSLKDPARAPAVEAHLRQVLPAIDTSIHTLKEAAARDQRFQTTQRPVGMVFGFGVGIGFLVGLVIVYQVLSTDVADHIKDYATFKAIGYKQSFFLSIVFEEAVLLACIGFIPGFLIANGLYAVVAKVASLPIAMTVPRAIGVLATTLIMCSLSGAIATRRLAKANPADLF